ncbi:hypothetical protein [Mesorhizobium sp. M1B.F.Ca.ET.045.04.1.1]|uniref:hypothetical protein n=1 Tax=Mesorhizobium sp. M1B.F.Ca.ET.045.04.1.1 TaxID=2493673 RepID=UPI000F751879|nr:hypothetical protein [Mesorhizobium sp. M1B.F.Ca.ET.045.04.1.1]AZO29365.1 hypothetical protein EJ071_19560 [Mesorhizobium sp. M1B.F.Ca.ET.045.04.1.1]
MSGKAKRTNIVASVHRFRDFIALCVGDGPTVYLSPKAASQIARALNKCARSVKTEKFTDSHFGSVYIEDGDEWRTSARRD